MSATVVGVGVDTLHLGFHGALRPGLLEELGEVLDRMRRDREADRRVELGGAVWELEHGDKWRVCRLRSAREGVVGLSRPGLAKNPAVTYEPPARELWSRGWRDCWARGAELARAACDHVRGPGAVSRLDLACDVIGADFGSCTPEEFVSRARGRARRGGGTEGDGGEGRWLEWTAGGRVETLQAGRGTTVMRVYDKTRELAAQSPEKRPWLAAAWAAQSGVDPLGSGETVWRVEGQLRREALKKRRHADRTTGELLVGVDSPELLEHAMPGLWAYLVGTPGGPGWLTWREPEGFTRVRKRPIRGEWVAIQQAAPRFGAPSRNLVPFAGELESQASLEMRLRWLLGNAKGCAAMLPERLEFRRAWDACGDLLEKLLGREGRSWLEELEQKRVTVCPGEPWPSRESAPELELVSA